MKPSIVLASLMIKQANPWAQAGRALLGGADDLARGMKGFGKAPNIAPRPLSGVKGNPFARVPPIPRAAPPSPPTAAAPVAAGSKLTGAANKLLKWGPAALYPVALGGALLQGQQAARGMWDHLSGLMEGRSEGMASAFHNMESMPWYQRWAWAAAPKTVMDSRAVHEAILSRIADAKTLKERWLGPGIYARARDRLTALRSSPKGADVELPDAPSYLDATLNMYDNGLRRKAEELKATLAALQSGKLQGTAATGVPTETLAQAQ